MLACGCDPSRPTSRTDQRLCYGWLHSHKADGTGREKVNKDPTPGPFSGYFVCILLYPLDHFYEVSVAWLLLLGHAFNGGWILEKITDTVKLDEVLQ